jgi:hypothetical protein
MKTQTLKKYVTVRIEEEIRSQLRLLAAWQQRPQLAVLRDLVEREVASAGIPVPGSKPFAVPTLPATQRVRRYPVAAALPSSVEYVPLDESDEVEFSE